LFAIRHHTVLALAKRLLSVIGQVVGDRAGPLSAT
jgi:hypothetical protein